MTESLGRLKAALAGRYALEREAGAGGMATVYLAQDIKHERKVAVKVLRPELAATLGSERFLREIKIAAQLQHPHILPLLDSGEADGFLYYVMPFIEGESLRERLSREGELPIGEAVKILAEVVDALAYAHSRGVVHRDIKPDNVMLSGRHALVTDFGVAKAVSEATGRQQMTTAGMALGTPAYMAPEQAAADPNVDHRADIYAVGAMGYEILTGLPPFTGLTPQMVLAAHVTQSPENVSTRRPAVPPALASVIMRCLAKRPADRWQNADQLLGQLEPLATPSGGMTPASTAPYVALGSAPDHWYGHPIRVAGLFTLASVAVLGAVYYLTIRLGLPDWVPRVALALLGAGLPIMVVTGLIERRRAMQRATGIASTSGETGFPGWITWRRAIAGGMAAFSVLGVGTLAYTAMRLLGIGPVGTLVASGKLAARDQLLVADFVNKAADTTLGGSVTEAFRIDLAQSPVVSVLGSSAVGAALTRMNRDPGKPLDLATARELAVREGVKAIAVGEISPVGKGYVLSAKVLSAADGSELVVLRENADDDSQILKAIDRLSKGVRERIGESLRTIRANEPLEQVTTGSLDALRLYTEGTRAANIGENDRAIVLLQQAVAVDSGFAMAWRKLAVALSNSGASFEQALDAATKAYAHRDRLPELERYQTTAFYFWKVEYDLDKAVAAYRAILGIHPGDLPALVNLGDILNQRRQWAEADSLALKATTLADVSSAYGVAIQAELAQGKTKEARITLDRFSSRVPDSPEVPFTRGQFFSAIAAYDSAQIAFHAVEAKTRDLGQREGAAAFLGGLELLHGRLDGAEQEFRNAVALAEQRKLPGDYLFTASGRAGVEAIFRHNPAEGLKIIDAALRRYPLNSIPVFDRPYTELAVGYAQAGQPGLAKRMVAEYEAAVPERIRRQNNGRHWADGYIALAEGRAQDALKAFQLGRDESGCTNCGFFELAQAYELAKQPDSALAFYTRAVERPHGLGSLFDRAGNDARSYKRLGELYEEKGDKEKALDYYGRFTQLWKDADAELQPQVKEVKERMARLVGEKKD